MMETFVIMTLDKRMMVLMKTCGGLVLEAQNLPLHILTHASMSYESQDRRCRVTKTGLCWRCQRFPWKQRYV